MTSLTASPHDVLRRTLATLDPDMVMRVVDGINLRGAKLSAVIAVPLRGLQRSRDVRAFAAGAPLGAVSALVELLAMEALEKVVDALGDDSESPSYERLAAVMSDLREQGLTRDETVAVLGFAAGSEFPAAPHCRRLLSEDEDLALVDLEITVGRASILTPKVADEEVREQRRRRREEQRAKKRPAPTPARPTRPKAPKSPIPTAAAASSLANDPVIAAPVMRRRLTLTPAEAARFDADHALVGWVVTAEVPYDSVDPAEPEHLAKVRPVLVVAASDEGLLVRGIYSGDGPTRRVFSPWRRVGLDHVSYLEDVRVAVARDEISRLAQLSVEEWNALV